MNIVSFMPPGRFPTVVHDPGLWWSEVVALGGHTLTRISANASWWRAICSPGVGRTLLASLRGVQRMRQRMIWKLHDVRLEETGEKASRALDRLCTTAAYESAQAYIDTIGAIAVHLQALNRAQEQIHVHPGFGARVRGLNYDSSAALADHAHRDAPLAGLLAPSLAEVPSDINLLLVHVTSPEDLFTAMACVVQLRVARPHMHVSLIDHGYENYSLQPHMERLRVASTIGRIFDTVIESKDDRDRLVPALVKALDAGERPRGFLRAGDLSDVPATVPAPYAAPPPVPTFTPEPIFWTRLSPRRCYWSKCTFCVQNAKYHNPRPPSRTEILPALDRIATLREAGYRTFIFSDEAVSPALLSHFSDEAISRGSQFRWACRSKLELSHDRGLFDRMRASGCYEVLFGLETIVPRVQKLMDKFVAGLDADRTRRILVDASEAGLGLHINLIGAFPSETPAELDESVSFTIDALSAANGATFLLNRFCLFPDTPMLSEPERFGIVPADSAGDIPASRGYRVVPELEGNDASTTAMIAPLTRKLLDGLGWSRFGNGVGVATAVELYFSSGHGAIFKTRSHNPFANPLNSIAEVA